MRIQIRLQPDQVHDTEVIERLLSKKTGSIIENLRPWYVAKRSIDARGKQPVYVLAIETGKQRPSFDVSLTSVLNRPEVHIVGSGPAGYFAALKVIEEGMRPIVLERGKDVKTRRRDLRALQQFGMVHPDSNYCFGEGGAGTYSDGKLYTRSVKRGRIEDVLQILVAHGAPSDILVDAHPHIGSNKLPQVVKRLRETIETYGGEVRFDSRVTGIEANKGRVEKLVINNSDELNTDCVILATGHSARDVYLMFSEKGWLLEFKPFAMGVRIEHPQSLVDDIQYGPGRRGEHLPASSYSLTCQVDMKGVFSFCMCPGGLIVPASTAPAELVVNGMSLSKRDSPFANAGTVVEIDQELITSKGYEGVLGGMNFQRDTERAIWQHGSGDQAAPAQRLTDFVNGVMSADLPKTSYIPGIYSARMDQLLPSYISERLQRAVKTFDKRMRGYLTEEAQVIGLESRTSSPVRIPRDPETGMHPEINGLFPCGEGAGFAGGIISAALDGRKMADCAVAYIRNQKIG